MIVTDEAKLRVKSTPVINRREGGEIARLLISCLEKNNKRFRKPLAKMEQNEIGLLGVGLAAIQIGISKQVCILYLNDIPLVLMNPTIVDHSPTKLPTREGCLSLPGQSGDTYRWTWIKVQTLNLGEQVFGPRTPKEWEISSSFLKSVVAQHEIGHLRGLTFKDFSTEDSQPDFC